MQGKGTASALGHGIAMDGHGLRQVQGRRRSGECCEGLLAMRCWSTNVPCATCETDAWPASTAAAGPVAVSKSERGAAASCEVGCNTVVVSCGDWAWVAQRLVKQRTNEQLSGDGRCVARCATVPADSTGATWRSLCRAMDCCQSYGKAISGSGTAERSSLALSLCASASGVAMAHVVSANGDQPSTAKSDSERMSSVHGRARGTKRMSS